MGIYLKSETTLLFNFLPVAHAWVDFFPPMDVLLLKSITFIEDLINPENTEVHRYE